MNRRSFLKNVTGAVAGITILTATDKMAAASCLPERTSAKESKVWPLRWNNRINKAERYGDSERANRLRISQAERYSDYVQRSV